jgi:hypothetical protein
MIGRRLEVRSYDGGLSPHSIGQPLARWLRRCNQSDLASANISNARPGSRKRRVAPRDLFPSSAGLLIFDATGFGEGLERGRRTLLRYCH